MRLDDSHLSDQELMLAADGELTARRAARVDAHLTACWACRARKQELEATVAELVRAREAMLDPLLPPVAGPRAMLGAQLAELEARGQGPGARGQPERMYMAAACGAAALALVAIGWWTTVAGRSSRVAVVSVPNANLTPGATVLVNTTQVCSAANPKNRTVPVSLQKQVFAEYGISGAEPKSYEVDYLITPALGGADDIHNLWPQSTSSTVWNARVKDSLEDRLRELVCQGRVDLATAQHDLSADWIAAYKKYFHTDRPVEAAR
jgi:Putative zinc-finger